MPIATLTFNLPEEQEEYNLCTKGVDYYSQLVEIDQKLRSIVKHGHNYKSVEDLAEEIREMIDVQT